MTAGIMISGSNKKLPSDKFIEAYLSLPRKSIGRAFAVLCVMAFAFAFVEKRHSFRRLSGVCTFICRKYAFAFVQRLFLRLPVI